MSRSQRHDAGALIDFAAGLLAASGMPRERARMVAETLVEADLLGPTVERMTSEVAYVPRDPGGAAEDRRIAALAAVLAVRRHLAADEADTVADIGLLVLTGGVFRRPGAHALAAVVATLRADVELTGLLAKAQVAVDADFAVAPAGMLVAAGHDAAARVLLQDHLLG